MADMSSGQQFTLGLLNTLGQAFISYKAIDEGIQLQEGFTPRISTVSMNEQVQPVGLGKDLGTTAIIVVGVIVLIIVLTKRR